MMITMGNAVWCVVMFSLVPITVLPYLFVRNRPEKEIRRILVMLSMLVIVLFFILRLMLFTDETFIAKFGTGWKVKLSHLLPFHLCYVTPLLLIAGLLADRKRLIAFSFYIGPIGAILAIAFPDGFYLDKPLFMPSVFLFYLLHALLIALYFNSGLYGFFRISWKDGVIAVFYLMALALIMHGVNLAGRTLGFYDMNYFYTMESGGSGLLETFHEWNPHPYLYLFLPCTAIGLVWTTLMTACYKVITLLRKKRRL